MKRETLKKLIGMRLRALRKKKGLTQEKLAERARLHTTFIAHVESGKKSISLNSLMRISQALNVPIYKIFAVTDSQFKKCPLGKPEKNLLQLLKNRPDNDTHLITDIARRIFKTFKKA